MPRIRRVDPVEAERHLAAAELLEFVGEPRERKPQMLSPARAMQEMNAMRTANDWSRCRPVHLVALYCWCHNAIYGVPPDELTTGQAGKRARQAAVGAARNLLGREFGGNVPAMVKFIQWVWQRAREKEEWAARSGAKLGRISWSTMFAGRSLLTDYKVEIGRQRAAR